MTHDKMRELASKWISKKEKLVIELGCNTGNFAELMNKKGVKYLGIDKQEEKIRHAKARFPNMNFMDFDILDHLVVLKKASTFVSFQCLEHIKKDKEVLKAIVPGTKVIISVPNSKYKGHVRWFELKGWVGRFSPYILLEKGITIQNPNKPNKRAFLFKGVRNDYKY
jgi:2-polyprenyl-3-methyl-5-hydroxy-6-metoxy-1,4-benzoquinol methylase